MNIEKAEAKSKLIEMSKQNIENKTKKELELKQKQEYVFKKNIYKYNKYNFFFSPLLYTKLYTYVYKHIELLEKRRLILKSLLTPEAHARWSRIAIVKEEQARKIEDIIIRNSQMGLIYNKIDDDHLIKIIEQINDKIYKKDPVIEIRRRKQFDDDDDFNEEDYM
ncbi:hypothetical protein PFHG_00145 [Plasmodium falciparum HB3]|uniref:Uncharacterized protein n=2 Tax=Plasmodium falciparum TaxID=5833 RepID=A0A0L7K556_PLAFX|nr:hypothetical protein PFHG_00145 [Plasmodium falciparum HB3]